MSSVRAFMSRLWIPVVLALGVLTLWISKQLNFAIDDDIRKLLPGMSGVISAAVLFALWKIEEDNRTTRVTLEAKIDEQTRKIKAEIDETDTAIHRLFLAFREQFGDRDFETAIEKLLLKYPELKRDFPENIVAQLALGELRKLSTDLEHSAVETNVVGVIEHYPRPFYQGAFSTILATDIVLNKGTHWPREHWNEMIKLNRETLARMRASLPKRQKAVIKRIFILEDDLSPENVAQTNEIMTLLYQAGVVVKWIQLSSARTDIQTAITLHHWRDVHDVEDFSVFDANNGKLKYAGRFRNTVTKTVVITTDVDVVDRMEKQFALLESHAMPFSPDSSLLRTLPPHPPLPG